MHPGDMDRNTAEYVMRMSSRCMLRKLLAGAYAIGLMLKR